MKQLNSIVGGKAMPYISTEKPGLFVPFKGNFPLATMVECDIIGEIIEEVKYFEDIKEDWVKEILVKGAKMYDIDQGFNSYLYNKGFRDFEFLKLDNSKKSDLLMDFLEENCMTIDFLKV